MHTYTRSELGLWTVGFELSAEKGYRNFRAIKDFSNEADAAEYASYLNGGLHSVLVENMMDYFKRGD